MLRYNSDFEEFEGYSNSKWNLLTLGSMKLKLDFDQTTTLPTGISFTRATNGKFFNSSGVLTTAGSGVARFDHRLEGVVWVNKGLLIEEQRVNLALYSEEFNTLVSPPGTGWFQSQTVTTANQITAPNGATTADAVKENSTANFHFINTNTFITLAANTVFTMSVFAKKFTVGSQRYLTIRSTNNLFNGDFLAVFNIDNGTITHTAVSGTGSYISSSIQDVGSGWFRCSVTGSLSAGTNVGMYLAISNNSTSGLPSYTGDNTSGFYLWGAQLEVGAFPTSYIGPTTTASVTRNADVASMTSTNFSSWYNASEGTTFWQGDTFVSGKGSRSFVISDNGFNERILIAPSTSTGTGFVVVVTDGGVSQASLLTPDPQVTPIPSQTYKHSLAYKVNDFAAALDGGAVATDTSGTLPTVDRVYLGSNANGLADYLNGHIAKFYYWNTRKPNEFLQRVTE
jgi:hypothetical protein